MKRMTLSEFQRYVEDHGFSHFRFVSENQEGCKPYATICFHLDFQSVRFFYPQSVIGLRPSQRDGDQYLMLTHVKAVDVDEVDAFGTFATVFTRDLDQDELVSYKLLLQ